MFTEGALRPWEALARDHGTMLKREAKRGAGSSRAHAKRMVWDRVVAPGVLYVNGEPVKATRGRIVTPEAKAREAREAARKVKRTEAERERAARQRKIARSWVGVTDRSIAIVDKSRD
jgi:hypothetical protein